MNFVAVAIVSAIVLGHTFNKRVVFDWFKLQFINNSYRALSSPGKKSGSQELSVFKLILLPTPCCYGIDVT